MARRLSQRATLVTSAALLLLILYLAAFASNSRVLFSAGVQKNDQLNPSPLQGTRAEASAGAAGERRAVGEKAWPESWGREVGFRPGVKLPNLGRTPDGWEGVHRDSGSRSPHYGDVQQRHQAWLLLRAKEMRSGVAASSTGSVDGVGEGSAGSGDAGGEAADGKASSRDTPPTAGPQAAVAEEEKRGGGGGGEEAADGGEVVGTRYEGGDAKSLDSEDWTNAETTEAAAAAAAEGRGLHSSFAPAAGSAAAGSGVAGASGDQLKRRGSRHRHPQSQSTHGGTGAEAPTPMSAGRAAAPDSGAEQGREEASRSRERPSAGGTDGVGGEVTETPPPPPPPLPTTTVETSLPTILSTALSTASTKMRGTRRRRRRRRTTDAGEGGGWAWGWGWGRPHGDSAEEMERKERVRRLERGAELWEGTYVPPIEPDRRRDLIAKWSLSRGKERDGGGAGAAGQGEGAGRILYVISSYDRGKRLGRDYREVDKLDYILLMLDEMREACELGFSPQVHLIAAWDPSEVSKLVQDRLFCRRTGEYVPYSFEQHPSSVRNNLAIKHRIYMKPRLHDFDVFLQTEDDMVVTLNHFLLFQEESDHLEKRVGLRGTRGRSNVYVPGFMRVEAGGDEWYEWEIVLSRFKPIKIYGAGTYMTLVPSKVLPRAGNNQGMWMATRGQLEAMAANKGCLYLDFDETSRNGMPETHSGSIQMFHRECGFEKVFPATHFEDFIVHHRTNNKNGRRGESIPGVSMTMLRVWAEQFIRDEDFLEVRHWTLLP